MKLQEDLLAPLEDAVRDRVVLRHTGQQHRDDAVATHPDQRADALEWHLVARFAQRVDPRPGVRVHAQHEGPIHIQQHSAQRHPILLIGERPLNAAALRVLRVGYAPCCLRPVAAPTADPRSVSHR